MSKLFVLAFLTTAFAYAQSPNIFCVTSAKPLIVRSEGIAERVGEIDYDCRGQPGTVVTANLTVPASVRSNLTTVLGRTAAYKNGVVTWEEMMRKKEKFMPDLKGLKA